jgi:superfamily II DNA or RNA helicase
MPTGSGKTWVQALIAKYFMLKEKPVTIIEPNDNLTS